MARPRKIDLASQPPTERELAPDTVVVAAPPVYVPTMPRQMRIERQNDEGVPVTRRFPQVRAGVCEYCGVLDPKMPGQYQYKLCPHYRGLALRCSYCPAHKDPDDVIGHAIVNVAEHPDKPNELIVWCDSRECSDKHMKRFSQANA